MNSTKALRIPTETEINGWIDDLFSPIASGHETEQYKKAMFAYEELTGWFIYMGLAKEDVVMLERLSPLVHINYAGLTSFLKKFQRDVYGVSGFRLYIKNLVKNKKLNAAKEEEVMQKISDLGLRISAENPRKTRVAAAFSLWKCVYRPVYIDGEGLAVPAYELDQFCANLNYWLASTFLMKFGEVSLGSGNEAAIRMERVRHDFTVRQVCLSTLETFYSSIFRATKQQDI